MTNPTDQLAFLRAQRDAAPDAATRAMFDALIAEKEAAVPPTASRTHTQHIPAYTTIAAAIAGDVHGDIYIVGSERTASTTALLAGYLRWLASYCGQLPLRGVKEQKAASDLLTIGLDQVYTQLATTLLTQRKVLEGATLKAFDAEAFLKQRRHTLALPQHHVQTVRAMRRVKGATPGIYEDLASDRSPFLAEPTPLRGLSLDAMSTSDLQQRASTADRLVFYGPEIVTEAIAASSRLVLLGEPGSGKSSALRFLALTLARAGLDATVELPKHLEGWQAFGEAGKLIPLFMPLLPLAQKLAAHPQRNGTAADLWAAIDAHLTGHGATAAMCDAMRAELARGHVLLLLDGLDEVAGGDTRRQVVQAVQAFATGQPQCRLVVACRVRAYVGEHNAAWQLPEWPTATLADWIPGQVQAFIAAWYTAAAAASAMPAARRDERIDRLQRAVAERADLQRLSVRPLLLTIMALVHLNDGSLPEDRVTLYSRCLDILLGQWEIAKDETNYGTLMQYIGLPNADVKSLRPLLARVAYAAQQAAGPGEVGRLRRADLRELVADALEQLKHPNPHEGAKRFLEYTDVRAGLLQASDAGDAYAFPHQTFQEYLAGLELISGVEFVQRIIAVRSDDRWRVPIFLGIGHTVSEGILSAPYQLLNRLLCASKRDAAQRQRDLVFAAELAEDVGWERLERGGDEFGALRKGLAEALAQVVEGTALPAAERVHAGDLLGRLGDLRPGVCSLPPDMVTFAGGSFIIGNTKQEYRAILANEQHGPYAQQAKDWYGDTINNQPMEVASFALARYLVTNAQYALFLADDGYDAAKPWWVGAGQEWLRAAGVHAPRYWNDKRFGQSQSNHPVVGVSWYEAMAFCGWLTRTLSNGYIYTLPSEAEWEYAARGPARRTYPWGSETPDRERANYENIYASTTAVGSFPGGATPQQVQDLAGNVWEWARSAYQSYPYNPDDGREEIDAPPQKRFALRGGSWYDVTINLRASLRVNRSPGYQINNIGFRLTRHQKL